MSRLNGKSIDKLIKIRPWECIINIYSISMPAKSSPSTGVSLAQQKNFQFQLQFKRPSITRPGSRQSAVPDGQIANKTLKHRLNSNLAGHISCPPYIYQIYIHVQSRDMNSLWQRSHLSQLGGGTLSRSRSGIGNRSRGGSRSGSRSGSSPDWVRLTNEDWQFTKQLKNKTKSFSRATCRDSWVFKSNLLS